MKKLIIIVSILLLLTGCSKKEIDDESYRRQWEINRCLDYLYNWHGYNTDNEYTLNISLKDENDDTLRLCSLLENGEELISYISADNTNGKYTGEGLLYTTYKNIDLGLTILMSNENSKQEYPFFSESVNINEHFNLEKIDKITVNAKFEDTEPANYKLIKDFIKTQIEVYDFEKGDEITVYEYLPVGDARYDKNSNSILIENSKNRVHPVSINDNEFLVFSFDENYEGRMGTEVEPDEGWLKCIESNQQFVLAWCSYPYQAAINYGKLIKPDSENDLIVPVLIKKSFEQYRAISENIKPREVIFSFIVE